MTHDGVEDLLAECLDAPSAEWEARVRAAGAERPDLADELLERLEIVRSLPAPRTSAPAVPGRLGEFRLLERLGGGGMGVVHRAHQDSLDRDVALKLIRGERLLDDLSRARFQREAEAVARLDHPNIIAVHAVGEEDGTPWFAMQLLEGASLAEVLRRVAGRAPEVLTGRDLFEAVLGSRRAPDRVAEIFRGGWVEACLDVTAQIARALAHAHARGVLHRDVKPSNIVLTPEGRAVLIDFGLTLQHDAEDERLTRSGLAVGTLVYMPPEQVLGRDALGPPADVYSLAATLHELLTLQPPYAGDSSAALEAAILQGDPDDLRARNRRVSEDARTVVTTGMAHRAADRYRTASAFAEDLESVLSRRPIRARRPGAVRRSLRWARRHPAAVGALVATAIAVVGIPLAMLLVERGNAAEVRGALAAERRITDELRTTQAELATALADARESRLEAEAAAEVASAESARAVSREDEARATIDFVFSLFENAGDPGEELAARDILDRARERVEDELSAWPVARARMLLGLGRGYYGLAAYDEAAHAYEEAARIFEEWDGPDGRNQLAYSLYWAGKAHRMCGRSEEALATLRRATELAESDRAPADPVVADHLAAFAEAHSATPRAAEGLAVRQRLLDHLLRHRPDDALRIAKARAGLGQALVENGQWVEGEIQLRTGVEDLRRVAPPLELELIQALMRLSNVALERGEFDEARRLLEEGRAKALERWGAAHDLVLGGDAGLAALELRAGRHERAVAIVEDLLPRIAHLPEGHPLVANATWSYLRGLAAVGRKADAAALVADGAKLELFRTTWGDDSPVYGEGLRLAAGLLLGQSDFEAGIATLERYVDFTARRPHLASEHVVALLSVGDLALYQLARPERAREAFVTALELIGEEAREPLGGGGGAADEMGLQILRRLQQVEQLAEDPDAAAAWAERERERAERLDL